MAKVEVEILERTLRDDNPRFAVVLAARAALRSVPALTFLLNRQRHFKSRASTRLVLTVFRALQCSWYASVYSDRIDPNWIHDAADAADAAARPIGSEGRTAIFVPSYAAYAAASNNAPYTAAVAMDGAPAANHFAALSTAFPAGRRQTADRVEARTREAGASDYEALRGGLSPHVLALRPLWSQQNQLAWTRNAWGWLKVALLATDEDWEVWTDWYDARLEGRPANEPLEFGRAAIPKHDWLRGPSAVNAQIKRLIADNSNQNDSNRNEISSDTAELLHNKGRLEEALNAYEIIIERFPDNVVAHNGYAGVAREMGRLDEALSAYENIIERFPDNIVANIGRAEILRETGREPPRVCRRLFRLSHAAMAGSCGMA